VERVTAILELAAARTGGVRLSDVADHLEAPTSSTHSLLRGLVAVGYLRESTGRYRLGPALGLLLGHSAPEHLVTTVRPELERLAAETGETAILGTRAGVSVVYVDQVESRELIRYAAPLYERRSLEHSSIGKLYLADLTARELDRTLGRGWRTTFAGLGAELEQARQTGLSYNRQETVVGVVAVASGVRSGGALIAGISVVGPEVRVTPKLDQIAGAVRAAVGRLDGRVRPPSQRSP
jgi:DNA-binding IclR family transcriptional regulator